MEKIRVFGVVLIAMGLAACGKEQESQSPPAPTPSVAASVPSPSASPTASPDISPAGTPEAVEGTRNVRFGDKFQLNGALFTHNGDGANLELHWESLAAQPLTYTVSVHVVNERGDILNQSDHPQDASARSVKAGDVWQDAMVIKAEHLQGAEAVAICLYHPGGDILKADRGRRDWNNVRLWIPLPFHN